MGRGTKTHAFSLVSVPLLDTNQHLLPFRHIITRHRIFASPIQCVLAKLNMPMKRGPMPVLNAGHQAMFLRVPVYVIDASLQILFILASMLPKPPLPNATLPLLNPGGTLWRFPSARGQIASRKFFLDSPPTERIIGIALGQRPNRVKMIRQQDDSHDFKWIPTTNCTNSVPQTGPRHRIGQKPLSPIGNDRKEIRPSRHIVSPIPRQGKPPQRRVGQGTKTHAFCLTPRRSLSLLQH